MNQEFLRQLTLPLPSGEAKKLFTLLCVQGMELYVQKEYGTEKKIPEYQLLTEAPEEENGIYYISAADRDAAVQIMKQADLGEFVSENTQAVPDADEVVKQAQDEYFRKRKMTLLETAVIVLAMMLFYLIRSKG